MSSRVFGALGSEGSLSAYMMSRYCRAAKRDFYAPVLIGGSNLKLSRMAGAVRYVHVIRERGQW